jgi:O-acetylserine/cysteine efflux transporter
VPSRIEGVKPRDVALAVLVAAIWGCNFVAISVGLDHLPPLLFNALRFTVAAVPAVLLVRRPRVAWRWIIGVALALCVVKFSLLFFGMAQGMPAGLSSLVLQSQAIFTMLLAVVLLRERPSGRQWAGLAVAAAGIGVVAWRLGPQRPLAAFLLVIGSALAWGLSNVAIKKASPPDILSFIVWVSAVAAPMLLALSFLVDGPSANLAAIRTIDLGTVAAVAYIALISTLAGFGLWGLLIHRYGASTVAPFSMLVPFFGIASAALFLDETIHLTDIVGGVLVVGGVLFGSWRGRTAAPVEPVTVPDRVPVTAAGYGSSGSGSTMYVWPSGVVHR